MINFSKKIKKKLNIDNNVVYVFIDAANVWDVMKSKTKLVDYKNFENYFSKSFKASKVKFFYYDAYPKTGTRDYSLDGKHKFFTYLKKGLGFEVIKKELKRIFIVREDGESVIEKGNMDVEMTIDAIHNIKEYDIAILLTGDSDFLALVNYLKNVNKKVYIFSSENNISRELRTGGSGYFDMRDISEFWGKNLRHRKKDPKNKTTLN